MTKAIEAGSPEHGRERYVGSCHCGAVRFAVDFDPGAGASRCNCSICSRVGQVGTNVKPSQFELLAGEGDLASYEWGHKVSKRYFCKHCGIHCFGRGHLEVLGGDFVSVNLNCLEALDPNTLRLVYWDGRHDNWMAGPRDTPWPIFATASA